MADCAWVVSSSKLLIGDSSINRKAVAAIVEAAMGVGMDISDPEKRKAGANTGPGYWVVQISGNGSELRLSCCPRR